MKKTFDWHNFILVTIGSVGIIYIFYANQICEGCHKVDRFWLYASGTMALLGKGAIDVGRNLIKDVIVNAANKAKNDEER